MDANLPYQAYKGDAADLFPDPQKTCMFVGAGISINAPSNLLPAIDFTRCLLGLCCINTERDNLLKIPTLRYEMIVEKIQQYIDYELEFMEYFEYFNTPNLIHLFLAELIKAGSIVFTTNFDYLIEKALEKVVSAEKHEKIVPVITSREFSRYGGEKLYEQSDKYRIFKLHGAMRNIITKIKTPESLMTTLSAFGKGKNVLTLDPAKKDTVTEAIKGRTLVIMGYSGSDDFDIAPMLRQLNDLERVVWIEHRGGENTDVYEFDPKKSFMIPKTLSRSESLLAQICSNSEAKVIMIKTNTENFIRDPLLNAYHLNGRPLFGNDYEPETVDNRVELKQWLENKFPNIPPVLKWKMTADLYYELGYFADFKRIAQKGLTIAKSANSDKLESEFENLLGISELSQKNFPQAIIHFQNALASAERGGHRYLKGARVNNLGLVYLESGDLQSALEKFEEALELGRMRGDQLGIASRLGNIATTFLKMKEFDKSLEYNRQALKIDEKIGNLIGRSHRLKNLGDLYIEKGENGKALEYYKSAYRIVQKLGDLRKTSDVLMAMAELQLNSNDIGNALSNCREAIHYLKSAEDSAMLTEAEELQKKIKARLS